MDDDKSIRTTLAAILEQEGYDVDTAEKGEEAIKKSNRKLFDLAVVDMRLPDMMGVELLGRMMERTPKMQKIILTGFPSMENAISSVNEGADGYILKPVNTEVVLTAIRKHLQKREEEAKYSQRKIVEFIETRAKELETKTQANQSP